MTSLRRFLSKLLDDFLCSQPPLIPAPPVVPEVPNDRHRVWSDDELSARAKAAQSPPAPPLGCFAAGLIKSMRDTPRSWRSSKRTVSPWIYGYYNDQAEGFVKDGVFVGRTPQRRLYISDGLDKGLQSHEIVPIADALHSLLDSRAAVRHRTAQKRQDRLKAPFVKLGCPDGEPAQPASPTTP